MTLHRRLIGFLLLAPFAVSCSSVDEECLPVLKRQPGELIASLKEQAASHQSKEELLAWIATTVAEADQRKGELLACARLLEGEKRESLWLASQPYRMISDGLNDLRNQSPGLDVEALRLEVLRRLDEAGYMAGT